jgi:hypothetical protein
MAGRRLLVTIVLFATILHAVSIARSTLPAQDGLKFIQVARQFHTEPWPDVVRGTDQHPLYPALIAIAQPLVSLLSGPGPDSWRIAAQCVAAIASIAILFPLFKVTRSLFDERIALIAAAIYVLLPVPAEVGHDTLSDSLGLLLTMLCLHWGIRAIRSGDWRTALAAGMSGGVGYLARPEVLLAPMAVAVTWAFLLIRRLDLRRAITSPALCSLVLAPLVLIGAYALVKGQVSEKLSLRHGAALGPQSVLARPVPQLVPRGLDDARWDFSAKEESERVALRRPGKALRAIASDWWDELCWGFAAMAIWGLVRHRYILALCAGHDEADKGRVERLVLAAFGTFFLAVVLRHSMSLGYLSGRHTLPLVLISVPWAAAGTFVCLRGLGIKLPWRRRTAWASCMLGMGMVGLVLVVYQLRPSHPSRWAHWAAGRWLAEHADRSELVLDTRGWARFVSEHPGYDYWHVRQALTDSHLSYVVVGHEELAASSKRSRTLQALLAFAARPVADFPMFVGHRDVGVRIYRFHRPDSWEGMAP